jgi:hypothetical protein
MNTCSLEGTARARPWLILLSFAFSAAQVACGPGTGALDRGSGVAANPSSLAPRALTETERRDGWRLLFDGVSLDGWRALGRDSIASAHWRVEDGAIRKVARADVPAGDNGRPVPGGDLMTIETFRDFELAFEWRVTPGANSGIKYNVSEGLSTRVAPAQAALGFEYQVLDDDRHPDGQNRTHRSGDLYNLIESSERKVLMPVGEWNTARILFVGNHGEHWLNGEKVVEFELGTARMDSLFALSKWSDIPEFIERHPAGHIVLQDHDDEVWYRNLRIRAVDPRQR